MIPRAWVILLAAGGSRRYGGTKQLARLDGETLLRRMARVALWGGAAGCVVVLGARAARLRREVAGLDLRIAVNRRWRQGLAGSLAVGVAALPATARGALILLADQAAIGPADLELLAAAWRLEPRGVVASRAGGRLGPPAILPRRLFRAIGRLQGDQGARELLRDPARRVIGIDLPRAAIDVDRPADLARVRRARVPGRARQSARSSRARRPRSSGAT
jgi:molybdenum cofactor cytidylyltransferase